MSLLTISQAVSDELGVIQPSTIISNTEATAVRLFSVMQAGAKYLRDNYDWAVLTKEHTFTSAANTAAYALPSGFERIIPGTLWDRTNNLEMIGPLTPAQWQYFKGAITSDLGLQVRWRLTPSGSAGSTPQNTLKIELENPAAATVAFQYISNLWCADASGGLQSNWEADTDVPILDEDLLFREAWWRALRAFGFPFDQQKEDSRSWCKHVFARERGGGQNINMAPTAPAFSVNLPDTGYGE